MAKIELPLADAAGSPVSRSTADGANCAPLDWRQLSHELRTPLNAILGNAELLLDGSSGPLSAEARARLGEIQTAGRQLLRQVQLLLAWSELCGADPLSATESWVDLIALVREALGRPRADAVEVAPPDARLWIWGDRSRLQMLVAEIIALDGARCAMPEFRVENSAGRSALYLAWPGFCAAQIGALQIALIKSIAWSQGVELALNLHGLSLLWPRQQPDRPGATGSTDDPS